MSNNWSTVRLGEVLEPVTREEAVEATKEYRLLGIRLDGRGPFLREIVTGTQTSAAKLSRVAKGDFIYSRLFAWRGAFGVIGPEFDGCYVSGEFPTFLPKNGKVEVDYLRHWFRLRSTLSRVEEDCSGSTPLTRNRFKEEFFLALDISLPPLMEQRRIVARIEDLAAKIEEARALRQHAAEEAEALIAASSITILAGVGAPSSVGEVCDVIDPNPSHRYPVYIPNGIPIVSSSEFVGEDGIDPSLAKHVPESFYTATLGSYRVGGGDLIFSRKGKVGYARLHPEGIRLAMTHTLCVIKPDRTKLEPRYLLHFARSPIFLQELTGTMNPNVGVPTLGLGVIRDAGIPLPSLPDQRRIVDYLDGIQRRTEALKVLQAETSAELVALMPSILERAFYGKL